eukprot:1594937-Pyramimonas_sp.AAC.1
MPEASCTEVSCTSFEQRCLVQYMRGTNVQNAGVTSVAIPPRRFPGASSVCNVRVPWTNTSPVRSTGVQ